MGRPLLLLLLCSCATPGSRPPDGALARAAYQGDADAVRSLLRDGADPNDRLGTMDPPINFDGADRWTALHAAAYEGRLEIVRLLLRAGAQPELDDGRGATPLDMALRRHQHGEEELPLLLIEAGAPVNTKDRSGIDDFGDGNSSVLHGAVGSGLRRTVRALLLRGADVNARTTARWTPLFFATDPEIQQMLLHAGAGINARDHLGETPLNFFVKRDEDEAAIALLKAGANPDIASKLGYTPLTEALDAGRLPLIRALIEAGADVNRASVDGTTPLQHACDVEEAGLLLLAKGANPEVGTDRWDIPLYRAVEHGYVRLTTALLDHGADLNRKDDDGNTALHVAAESEKEEMVRLLLHRGADTKICNKEGKTAAETTPVQRIRNLLGGER